jgi:DNA-binding NarL/FixJ family response regulator
MAGVRQKLQQIIEESEEFICLSSYSTAEKALEELPDLKPDIVLMDIHLPGMNGIECIKEIKKQSPQMQFMMFTIYENSEQVYEALAAGASGYLLKQTPPEQILLALKELYEGGSPMSTHIARKVVSFFKKKMPSTTTPLPSPTVKSRYWSCFQKDFFIKRSATSFLFQQEPYASTFIRSMKNYMFKTGQKQSINFMEEGNNLKM